MDKAFHIFSEAHILALFVTFTAMALVFILRYHFNAARYSFGFVLLSSEVLEQLWKLSAGRWSLASDLPLHLSDLAVILAIIMTFTKNKALFQFLWYAGIASSFQAIVSPDLGPYTFPHPVFFTFFVSHAGVIMACLLFAAKGFRPSLRSLWITAMLVNLYAAAVFWINHLLNSNYLYIMKKPAGGSLLEVLGPWPWYLLSMEGVMLVSFFLLYLPFRSGRTL
ncbi:TIGR02206 family membrane protein [Metabacillus sp. FJAT-52054]|uniref:TIGR02206 family membrane protein n=1 Tax=Metabacillus sediminis TaxID=3117746 RepID=A0ABZ2NLC9_9BACI